MMKNKIQFIIYIIFSLLLVGSVSATGLCSNDKYEYHPGETITFSCTCTSYNERYKAGYIVFQNSTDILRSTLVNSGNCQNSFFGDSYVFDSDANFTGNVTFSLNADGTGTPNGWSNTDDDTSDDFNVSGVGINDCIIEDIIGSPSITLDDVGAVRIKVKDGLTEESIIHASCYAAGYDISNSPLIFEPQGSADEGFKYTSANGEVGFIHDMIEDFWQPNTTYLFEFFCFSLPYNSSGNHVGYLESGSPAGMKTCTAQSLFTTGLDEREQKSYDYLPITIVILGVIGFLIVFSFNVDGFYNFEYKEKFYSAPLGKLFIWSLCLWLLAPLINVGIISNMRGQLGLTNTIAVFYNAIVIIDYVIVAFWFVFIMYWLLSNILQMATKNKK